MDHHFYLIKVFGFGVPILGGIDKFIYFTSVEDDIDQFIFVTLDHQIDLVWLLRK